jgi:protein-tyrosine phosphatase
MSPWHLLRRLWPYQRLRALVRRRYGSGRGLLRLLLARLELLAGTLARFTPPLVAPRRLVFVCQGNICRSAFAAAQATELGLAATSLGLATTTGAAPPAVAVAAAARLGIDLRRHRACDWNDFVLMPGDLLLAMEVRQAHELLRRLNGRADVGVALLGLCGRPTLPHIHDPFTLDAAYFDTCFVHLRRAVQCLPRGRLQLNASGAGPGANPPGGRPHPEAR